MKTLALILLLSTLSFSQVNDSLNFIEPADIFPTIIGGLDSLHLQLQYPKKAMDNDIWGKVILTLNLDTLGNIVSVKVLKGLGYGCDEEAIRLIKTARFTPAYIIEWKDKSKSDPYYLKPVAIQITIPITFKLK